MAASSRGNDKMAKRKLKEKFAASARNSKRRSRTGDGVMRKAPTEEAKFAVSIPRSMAYLSGESRGCHGMKNLIQEFRRLLLPWTMEKLKENRRLKLKDYLDASSKLHISHIFDFHRKMNGNIELRLAYSRGGKGPTFNFKLLSYTLQSDIRKAMLAAELPRSIGSLFCRPPVFVMQGFKNQPASGPAGASGPSGPAGPSRSSGPPGPEEESDAAYQEAVEELRTVCSKLFPAIELADVALGRAGRRVVLFHWLRAHKRLEIRHYAINRHNNTNNREDLLPDPDMPDQNNTSTDFHLIELGPRLSLELKGVQNGLFKGAAIYP